MRPLLYSLSIIYGMIAGFRNLLFNYKVLKSKEHNIPIICIGNLSLGGTGKTPHTNYIARLLSQTYKVAILSRGYGRKTSGFNYVETNSLPSTTGDEPIEIKKKNPNCIVAVNKNRNKGVERIISDHPKTDVIILDDGFQHRWIKATFNIIITPFHKPFINDNLLPLGSLREHKENVSRADVILISKTPAKTTLIKKRGLIQDLNIKKHQKGYFSSIKYANYKCMKNDKELEDEEAYSVTLVTGIADPNTLVKHLESQGRKVFLIKFADHHYYTSQDISKILLEHNNNKDLKKLILTTEKDTTKLKQFLPLFKEENIYYITMNVAISEEELFNKQLLNHVKKN